MKILVTGASGLVGTALVRSLESKGRETLRLVRNAPAGGNEVRWNPSAGTIDAAALEGIDAAVHLAGENLAEGRWTDEKKRRIRESRVKGTRLISETLAALARKPEVLLSASAVGFYGSRGDEVLTEQSAAGEDFLAEVCREWEEATAAAEGAGIRVAHLRFGVILSGEGGALKKMLTPFRLGVGGKLGDGRQYMSWVTLDDAVSAIEHALSDKTLSGPVNVVAPRPVTNKEFTKAMGSALSRPTFFSVPAFAARLAFGEMADATLLSSQRAQPARLTESGFAFKHPEIEAALRHVLK